MKKRVLLAVLCTAVTGCITVPSIQISSHFDSDQAKELLRPGVNIIEGSALIRQNGGGVVTCAGLPIQLIPKTSYATERLTYGFGNTTRGFAPIGTDPRLAKDEPAYYQYMKQTTCNAQGFFEFDHVADGDFYVVANITWNVAGQIQGGALMQSVSVRDGEAKELVLSP